jgi:anti-sigma factor RsiW
LDPEQLDQFEEHLFDCPDCALDVRAAAMLVEQSKNVFSENPETAPVRVPQPTVKPWLSWLRPAFAVPVMAALIAVIGYQNLVSYPKLQTAFHLPQVVPWAAINVGTWGAGGPVIQTSAGQGFLLFVRIPPDASYARYTADLYNPAGKLEWTLHFAASPGQDQWPMQVPAANRESGTYILAVHGATVAGESKDLGRASFELQIQK